MVEEGLCQLMALIWLEAQQAQVRRRRLCPVAAAAAVCRAGLATAVPANHPAPAVPPGRRAPPTTCQRPTQRRSKTFPCPAQFVWTAAGSEASGRTVCCVYWMQYRTELRVLYILYCTRCPTCRGSRMRMRSAWLPTSATPSAATQASSVSAGLLRAVGGSAASSGKVSGCGGCRRQAYTILPPTASLSTPLPASCPVLS